MKGTNVAEQPACTFYKLPRINRQERLDEIKRSCNLDEHPFENHGGILSKALYEIQGWNGTDCVRVEVTHADQREIAYAIKELAKLDWTAKTEQVEVDRQEFSTYLYIS